MSDITLTSSMRANLSSLRMISGQMGKTQERLSTGLKVNSAIDNASSYYQARSLTNRAADLNALLDSMGQGIQTINAAIEGLESGTAFLEQATAVATEAHEIDLVELPKTWFEEQAKKQGGVVVSNAAELKAALLETKNPPAMIVIYGKIDFNLDAADFNRSIYLKNNQKLVGTEYFANIDKNALFRGADNKRLSELNITSAVANRGGISMGTTGTTLSDLTLNARLNSDTFVSKSVGAETAYLHNIDINLENLNSVGMSSCLNIFNGAVKLTGTINFSLAGGGYDQRVMFINGSQLEIDADVNFLTQNRRLFWRQGFDAQVSVSANSKITAPQYIRFATPANSTFIAAGAKIGLTDSQNFYQLKKDFDKASGYNFNADNMSADTDMFKPVEAWNLTEDHTKIKILDETSQKLVGGYNTLLSQYDRLISDTSYQGINLLKGGRLNMTFNETRSHRFTIKGADISSGALGVRTAEWENMTDVAKSLNDIVRALASIRSFQSELGNNYQIIQTRQNFTGALVDVLETGSDNLTLADMNEESANYLALQTRQHLAINSLSLAAQSAQSILSLF